MELAVVQPTVGRIVWYKATNRDTAPRAAIIESVTDDPAKVNLNVIKPGTLEYVRNAIRAESFATAQAGQWAWPEKV